MVASRFPAANPSCCTCNNTPVGLLALLIMLLCTQLQMPACRCGVHAHGQVMAPFVDGTAVLVQWSEGEYTDASEVRNI
jgi:hypothetical protein